MTAVDPALRAEAEQHIREHVEVKRARVERVSRIRELVLGAQDGLLVPLGVVSGMAAASPRRTAILVAGFPAAVTRCIAMAAGSYLASEAEEALSRAEVEDERREVIESPIVSGHSWRWRSGRRGCREAMPSGSRPGLGRTQTCFEDEGRRRSWGCRLSGWRRAR